MLPGVTITVSGPGLREEAITDENGRFDVDGLLQGPPSTYMVTAELAGFSTGILDKVRAEPGSGAEIGIALQVACLETILHVDDGLAANLKRADGVFLLRIESSSPPRHRKVGDYCGDSTEHVATVIEIVKDRRGAAPMTLRFLVEGNHQYGQGTHHFAFLSWESSGGPASDVLTALRSLVARP